jgi:hypothetical protein
MIGQSAAALKNANWTFSFPIAFPNACERIRVWWESNANGIIQPEGAFSGGIAILEAITPYGLTGGAVFTDWDNAAVIHIALAANDGKGLTGIGWEATGY